MTEQGHSSSLEAIEHAASPEAEAIFEDQQPETITEPAVDTYSKEFANRIGLGEKEEFAHEVALDAADKAKKDQQLADLPLDFDKVM